MTDQEINIAISKPCGWKIVPFCSGYDYGLRRPDGGVESRWDGEESACYDLIPPYTTDLNAMAEAETILSENQRIDYIQELQAIIVGVRYSYPEPEWIKSKLSSSKMAVFATARQRAEAFLRTLNLWKE